MTAAEDGPNLGTTLTTTAATLAKAGIGDSRRQARALLAIALGLEPLQVLTNTQRRLDAGEESRLAQCLARRLAGEPLSRIAGRRGFWSLDLTISPDVLDPRPETELLVESALAHVAARREEALRILDLGTGSGCIALALLSELPNAVAVVTDHRLPPLLAARGNATVSGHLARVFPVASRWACALAGPFDIIVSNPPYIPSGAVATLDQGVRAYDPADALDGGPDGMAPYRLIIPDLPNLLAHEGIACLEVGKGQAPSIAEMGRAIGLSPRIETDLARIQRCVTFRAKKEACKPRARR